LPIKPRNRRHPRPHLGNELRVKLLVRADGPGEIPGVQKRVANSHPQELSAQEITHDPVRHRASERARSRETGAFLGCPPLPLRLQVKG
jgi:hypothetical protein